MTVCPECGGENNESARFCRGCGQPVSKECPACGRIDAPNAVFCTDCGAKYGNGPVITPAGRPPTVKPVVQMPAPGNRRNKKAIFIAAGVGGVLLIVALILLIGGGGTLQPQVGDEWVYTVKEHGRTSQMTMTVTDSKQSRDTVELKVTLRSERSSGREMLVKMGPDGISLADESDRTGSFEFLVKYPLKAGTKWECASSGYSTTEFNVEGEETVTVPAGTYKCWKVAGKERSSYGSRDEGSEFTLWFSQSAGFVKFEGYDIDNGRRRLEITAELEKFNRKKSGESKSPMSIPFSSATPKKSS